jgi:isoleucyl-tRNA synthetase
MRWFLMSSSVLRGGNLVVTEEGIRAGVREFLLPLWNTWYFFSTYANAARATAGPSASAESGYDASWRTDSTDVLDRYILALTGDLVRGVAADLDGLDSTTAAERLRDFAEVLTNWYIRRSRDRFWVGVRDDDPSSTEAFDTLYTVLETLTRVAAPLIPLVSEQVWQGLTGGRSVHLTDWPDADAFPASADIRVAMDAVREVSSVANALRKREGKRVRLPLPRLTVVVADAAALGQFEDILRDELNIKSVELVELVDGASASYGISHRLTVNARALGPRLGKQVQQVIQAARAGDWSETDGVVSAGGVELQAGEYELVVETAGRPEGEALAVLAGGGFVLLDTTTDDALEAEGLARDVVRAVQDTRKGAGFDVSDRIRLVLSFSHEEDAAAVSAAFDVADVAGETLAREAAIVGSDGATTLSRGTLRGTPSETPEHQAEFAKGTFANAGAFTVSVTRLNEESGE